MAFTFPASASMSMKPWCSGKCPVVFDTSMCTTRNSMVECSGSTFQRAGSACASVGHAVSSEKVASAARTMRAMIILQPLSLSEPALLLHVRRRFRLSVRRVPYRLHVTRFPSNSGPHADVNVDRFVCHISGHRWKWLGVDHGINPCFINLTDTRSSFNFDQLRAAVRIQLEPHADGFAARPSPDATHLPCPAATDQKTDLLPISLPVTGVGERHEILFDQSTRGDRGPAWLGLIDNEIAGGGLFGTDSRRLAGIADRLLTVQGHVDDALHDPLEFFRTRSGERDLNPRGFLMNRGPARGDRIEGDFRLERGGFAILLERDDLRFKQDGFAQRDDRHGSGRHPAEGNKQCERLTGLQFAVRILLMEFKACPPRDRTGGRGSGEQRRNRERERDAHECGETCQVLTPSRQHKRHPT